MRLYVDTNIIMDFLEGRDRRAHDFFLATHSCRHNIVISSFVLQELERQKVVVDVFISALAKRKKIHVEQETIADKKQAEKLSTHYADARHAAIALRLGIPVLTQNTKDFLPISGLEVITYADIR